MEALLLEAENVYGQLDEETRGRLRAVISDPNEETWSDAYSIIVSWSPRCDCPRPRCSTLWQGVIAVDPSYPRTGPRTDEHGNVLKTWDRIPDTFTMVRAIKHILGKED